MHEQSVVTKHSNTYITKESIRSNSSAHLNPKSNCSQLNPSFSIRSTASKSPFSSSSFFIFLLCFRFAHRERWFCQVSVSPCDCDGLPLPPSFFAARLSVALASFAFVVAFVSTPSVVLNNRMACLPNIWTDDGIDADDFCPLYFCNRLVAAEDIGRRLLEVIVTHVLVLDASRKANADALFSSEVMTSTNTLAWTIWVFIMLQLLNDWGTGNRSSTSKKAVRCYDT